jgi:hypothetical protein
MTKVGIGRNFIRIECPHSQVRMISVDDQRFPSAGDAKAEVRRDGGRGTRQANGSRFASKQSPHFLLQRGQMFGLPLGAAASAGSVEVGGQRMSTSRTNFAWLC